MKEVLDRLRVVQELDTKILRLEREMQKLPESLEGHRRALEEARERHRSAGQEGRTLHREADKKNLDLQSAEAEIKKLEGQLNNIKTNREYTALLHEIAGRKADKAVMEEEVLRLTYRAEELEAVARGVQTEVTRAEEEFQREEARTRGELKGLESQVAELKARRSEATTDIDPEVLAQYDRILRSRGGLALAQVRDGICQGCNMKVTTHDLTIILQSARVVHCRTCSRILYMGDGAVPDRGAAPEPGEE